MGYSKDKLLAHLKDLQIEFSQYEHPAVMTVEAQAKYVGNMGGGLSKNLFMKDKKHRFYIVSALADTKVDMKVLSQRLGLGKGGLRMAPEEALLEILQMLHCCWIKDSKLRNDVSSTHCPMTCQSVSENALDTNDLDKFLKSIGRDPAYVDLEANPTVGKDQPPDLAAFVPSGSTVLPDLPEQASALQSASGNHVSANSNSKAATEKATKPTKNVQNVKKTSAKDVHPSSSFTDAEKFVEEILDRISAQLLFETKEDSIKQQGEEFGIEIANRLRKNCCPELKNLVTIFKNTAYTQGFHAGRASSSRQCPRT